LDRLWYTSIDHSPYQTKEIAMKKPVPIKMQPNYFAVMFVAVLMLASTSVGLADDDRDAASSEKPNVILMMADDLAYGDVSCYGGERIRTPKLDQLAREGVRLTDFYAGATVCTPSRMALLTGAYPTRVGWPGGVIGHRINPRHGLAPAALTIAEVFKDAGYATALIGKWHLGDAKELQPMNQGFDLAYYIKQSNNQTKQLWLNEELIADPFDNRRLSEQFATEAIKFIRENRAKPFFLYLPFTAPHFPAEAHPDWDGHSNNHAYGDVVEELDFRVGEILEALKSEKIDQRTIVVFLSDNGTDPSQRKWSSSGPFRGLKWSSLEGGTRVPCLIRWPGVIPAGQTIDELTAAIDLLPTLAHACDIDMQRFPNNSPKIDGVNVWDSLIKKPNSTHARTNLLYWNGWAELQAIRVGTWKLFLGAVEQVADSDRGPVLIDLRNDAAEQTNLAEKFPDRVKSMQALASELVTDIENHSISLDGD